MPGPAVTLTTTDWQQITILTSNKLIWQVAFHPVSCVYTLNILSPVSHFGINNRLESENRLLIGFLLLSVGKKHQMVSCTSYLLLSPNIAPPFLQSIFTVLFPFLPTIPPQSSSCLGIPPDVLQFQERFTCSWNQHMWVDEYIDEYLNPLLQVLLPPWYSRIATILQSLGCKILLDCVWRLRWRWGQPLPSGIVNNELNTLLEL